MLTAGFKPQGVLLQPWALLPGTAAFGVGHGCHFQDTCEGHTLPVYGPIPQDLATKVREVTHAPSRLVNSAAGFKPGRAQLRARCFHPRNPTLPPCTTGATVATRGSFRRSTAWEVGKDKRTSPKVTKFRRSTCRPGRIDSDSERL